MNLRRTWESPVWREQVQRWIDLVLESVQLEATGPLEQARIRFWSTQLTVPTNLGKLWFKENNPGQFQEAAIVGCLSELVPDHIAAPLAIKPTKGWMLSPDHGKTLASLKPGDHQLWARVVTDFADLQQKLTPHRGPLTTAGLVGMDPGIAGNFAANQLLLHTGLPPEHPLHLSAKAADGVHAAIPRLEEAAAALTAVGVPLSLEHSAYPSAWNITTCTPTMSSFPEL